MKMINPLRGPRGGRKDFAEGNICLSSENLTSCHKVLSDINPQSKFWGLLHALYMTLTNCELQLRVVAESLYYHIELAEAVRQYVQWTMA